MMNFRQYNNCTKIVIPGNVRLSTNDFSGAFTSMQNLQYLDIDKSVEEKINIISNGRDGICYRCSKLIKTAVCGNNVIDMSNAYNTCTNLTTAVCGSNVTNMSNAYNTCTNLTTAACGNNVIDMGYAYSNCTNLTTAIC